MFNKYHQKLSFDRKNVVVTGGAGLLGQEIVRCFCEFGARTIIADIENSATGSTFQQLKKEKISVERYYFDMAEIEKIPEQIELIEKQYGSIDVWVNCAYPRTSDWADKLENVQIESWKKNIDIHLNSYCISSNEVAKRMAKKKGGAIINIGSIHSLVAPDFKIYENTNMTSPAAYTAIKGGIAMYSKYLASYYGQYNVRVNVVCPGGIFHNQPKEFIKRYCQKTLLKRMADAEDIAPAVVFLSSDLASYITGTLLVVDGGLTAI